MDLGSLRRFGRACLLLVAFAVPSSGDAGEVQGVVVEAWSRVSPPLKRLSGVTVQAKLRDGRFVDAIGMTTNNDGAYRIVNLPEEVVEVHFSCDGFLEKPTIERNVEIKKDTVTKRDTALTSIQTEREFFEKVADSAARMVADDYKPGYQKLWLAMYQTNIPVTQKPDFAKAMVRRDNRVLEAIPQIAQYLEVDDKQLMIASKSLAEAFRSQDLNSKDLHLVSESKELRSLPPFVYADLVTGAAKNAPKYDHATIQILNKLALQMGEDRHEALRDVISIRLNGELPTKSPSERITNPK